MVPRGDGPIGSVVDAMVWLVELAGRVGVADDGVSALDRLRRLWDAAVLVGN